MLCSRQFACRLVALLGGWRGRLCTAGLLAAYLFVALSPFQWRVPLPRNGAVWIDRGSILFSSPGLARTPAAPKWLDRVSRGDEFKVRLRVRPTSVLQTGPAVIFTVSANQDERNVTIRQDGTALLLGFRTVRTNLDGDPHYIIPNIFRCVAWYDIELAVGAETATLLVDDKAVLVKRLPPRRLANWDGRYCLALGNELNGGRPWLGEISQATVEIGADAIDYLASGALTVPPRFWVFVGLPRIIPTLSALWTRSGLLDALLNLLAFIPVGFVPALSRRLRRPLLVAVGLCATASLAVEVTQFFFLYRVPSVSDWILNLSGGAVGALCAHHVGRAAEHDPNLQARGQTLT